MSKQALSQEEVDALMQGMGNDAPAAPAASPEDAGGVRSYDLAKQERIVRGRMPAMEIIGERFARNLRVGLFNLIRKSPEVQIGPLKVHKYSAFLREIVVPTNFNIVSLKPLRGLGLVVCEPSLVFATVDALYGGIGKFHTRMEGRDFSPTEQRVIHRLVDVILTEYRKAWQGTYPLECEYQRSEMQPQFATIATPSEVVVTTSFSLEIGETTGAVHFCLPYAALEPIRDALHSSMQSDTGEPDTRWVELLKHQIVDAEVDLVTDLASTTATVEQLLALMPGDFLELDLLPIVQSKVDGVPVFDCSYGTSNGRYAIRIHQMLAGARGAGWLGDHHGR